MGFEPQKFFIGVIDFFAILMPGALLAYLVMVYDPSGPWVALRPDKLSVDAGWAVFLLVSYLIGHFLFLIGALVLDRLYDALVDGVATDRVARLAEGRRAPSIAKQTLAAAVLGALRLRNKLPTRALRLARHLKEEDLDAVGDGSASNTFQWCKTKLALEKPEGLTAVERQEADSKLFRSLAVALVALLCLRVLGNAETTAAAIALLFAFWRYLDQRIKTTRDAYLLIIAGESRRSPPRIPNGGATHAGGVVYKGEGRTRRYLLVRPKSGPREWVLPKGHIESGESARETAVREVREEAGVWAAVERDLGTITYTAGRRVRLRVFLMKRERLEDEAETCPIEAGREPRWAFLEDAIEMATHAETKRILERLRFDEAIAT